MPMRRMLILMVAVTGMFGNDAFAVYDAGSGRWLERDPKKYVDGLNLYNYGLANPVVFSDSSGLCADSKDKGCVEPAPNPNPTQAECCKAMSDGGCDYGDYGGVICCNGKIVSCAWNQDSDPDPKNYLKPVKVNMLRLRR